MRKVRVILPNQLDLFNPLITQPSESFTPRQIIEQFGRNELSCVTFEPSDTIDDSLYSDDVMVDNVINFEDEFDAIEYMQTTKVRKSKQKDEVQNTPEGNQSISGSSTEGDDSVPVVEHSDEK